MERNIPQNVLIRRSNSMPVNKRRKNSASKSQFRQNMKVATDSKVAENKLRFHSYYSDRMVFQKEVKNNIWGYSDKETLTAKYICL